MKPVTKETLEEFFGNVRNYPLLILDEVWLNRFPKDKKTKKVKHLEKELKEKMKEEARLIDSLKRLKASKSVYLKEILLVSEKIQAHFSDTALRLKMEEINSKVLKINESLIETEDRLAKIPDEIRKVNLDLLSETINICYNSMKESEEKINSLSPKIDELRTDLKKLASEKAYHEENRYKTVSLLNAIVGREVVDFLDGQNDIKKSKSTHKDLKK